MSQANNTQRSQLERFLLLVLPYSPVIAAGAFAFFAPLLSGVIFLLWVASFFFTKTELTNKKTGEKESFYDPKTAALKALVHGKGLTKTSIALGYSAVDYIEHKSDVSDVIYQACETSRKEEVQKLAEEYIAASLVRASKRETQQAEYARILQETKEKYL